ncbi:MAG: hypothetical protein LQ344_001278 [Seirophora lacunosa]|nr:MAG: hypothetical protein LQ344_001278 [Seirophora lacunosa]
MFTAAAAAAFRVTNGVDRSNHSCVETPTVTLCTDDKVRMPDGATAAFTDHIGCPLGWLPHAQAIACRARAKRLSQLMDTPGWHGASQWKHSGKQPTPFGQIEIPADIRNDGSPSSDLRRHVEETAPGPPSLVSRLVDDWIIATCPPISASEPPPTCRTLHASAPSAPARSSDMPRKKGKGKRTQATSTQATSTDLVRFDPSPNVQMLAFNPQITAQITLQLLFASCLEPMLAKLDALASAFGGRFRGFLYGLLEMSMANLAFFALNTLRDNLDFCTADPTVDALLYVVAAFMPYIGRLAPYVRQFFAACFELVLGFAGAIGHCIPDGTMAATRGFFVHTVPSLLGRSFTVAGEYSRQAGRGAVTIVVVPARFVHSHALVPAVRLPRTVVAAVDRTVVRPSVASVQRQSRAFRLFLRSRFGVFFWIAKHLLPGRYWSSLVLAGLLIGMLWASGLTSSTLWAAWVAVRALLRILLAVGSCTMHAIEEEVVLAAGT